MARLQRFGLVGVAALLLVAVFIAYVVLVGHPGTPESGSFNYSQTLPTVGNYSGAQRCGTNVTEGLSVPGGVVEYLMLYFGANATTVRNTTSTVNYWFSGPNLNMSGWLASGSGTSDYWNSSGLASHYTFIIQGCGFSSGVPVDFWGVYQPSPISNEPPLIVPVQAV